MRGRCAIFWTKRCYASNALRKRMYLSLWFTVQRGCSIYTSAGFFTAILSPTTWSRSHLPAQIHSFFVHKFILFLCLLSMIRELFSLHFVRFSASISSHCTAVEIGSRRQRHQTLPSRFSIFLDQWPTACVENFRSWVINFTRRTYGRAFWYGYRGCHQECYRT